MKMLPTLMAIASTAVLAGAQQAPATPRVPSPAPSPKAAVAPRKAEAATIAPGLAPLPLDLWMPLDELVAPAIDAWLPLPPLSPMVAPAPAIDVWTPLPPLAPSIDLWTPLPPLPALAPAIDLWTPLPPMPPLAELAIPSLPASGAESVVWALQGQGPTPPAPARTPRSVETDLRRLLGQFERDEAARIREIEAEERAMERELQSQLRSQERESEQLARAMIRDIEQQERTATREAGQLARTLARDVEMQERVVQRELDRSLRNLQGQYTATIAPRGDLTHALTSTDADVPVKAPASWAPQDVADSVWQRARELFNRGEWGQAVQAFRAIPTRYPNSAYAQQSAYYQAFSLFRIGGTTELKEAITALDAARAKYPNAQRTEAATLATRILGVLATRGDADAQARLRTISNEPASACDREEQAVQAEAMNALSRSDASNVNDLITRVLARKDECAIPLRRTAVFLVGNRRDAQAVTILAGVARTDPSVDVKVEAIGIIGRLANEEGVAVLEELVRSDDERVQRAAIRALVRHPSARARTSVRALVERDDVSERVRSEALSAFDAERATAEDVAWLRALYAKVATPSLKARTLSAIVRVGGPEVDQWLVTIARDDNQPSEIRATAMRRIGETMAVADLGRLYDGATQQRFRSEIISVLGKRKEDAAADKLIDIVKNGTDPSLRTAAIRAITNKNDARATQLLLEIINK